MPDAKRGASLARRGPKMEKSEMKPKVRPEEKEDPDFAL